MTELGKVQSVARHWTKKEQKKKGEEKEKKKRNKGLCPLIL